VPAPLETPLQELVNSLLEGNRRALAKVITLLESQNPSHQEQAARVLEHLLPHSGKSIRVGISGAPGVGKSTFLEVLGMHLVALGHKVAVLAVDPSSSRTGGSLLGDKTRMQTLSVNPGAFVRPSPASGSLGGTARRTFESLLACEAAGFDVVLVETVGVGQSETAVAHMTDTFVLLTHPGAGDELQGIKRGIMELADVVVVNKADLNSSSTRRAQAELESALSLLTPHDAAWRPRVLTSSAQEGTGIVEVWDTVLEYRGVLGNGLLEKRQAQSAAWFETLLREQVWNRFLLEHRTQMMDSLERVQKGDLSAPRAVEELLDDPKPVTRDCLGPTAAPIGPGRP